MLCYCYDNASTLIKAPEMANKEILSVTLEWAIVAVVYLKNVFCLNLKGDPFRRIFMKSQRRSKCCSDVLSVLCC